MVRPGLRRHDRQSRFLHRLLSDRNFVKTNADAGSKAVSLHRVHSRCSSLVVGGNLLLAVLRMTVSWRSCRSDEVVGRRKTETSKWT